MELDPFAGLKGHLHDWAQWSRGLQLPGGIPQESILGRLVRLGPSAGHEGGARPIEEMPDYIRLMDDAVLALPEPLWRELVVNQWIRGCDTISNARRLHVSKATIAAWRTHAYCWLSGYLSRESV